MTSTLDMQTMWDTTLPNIGHIATTPAEQAWLRETHPVGFTGNVLVIAAPHDDAQVWLSTDVLPRVQRALSDAAGLELKVIVTTQTQPTDAPATIDLREPEQPAAAAPAATPVAPTMPAPMPEPAFREPAPREHVAPSPTETAARWREAPPTQPQPAAPVQQRNDGLYAPGRPAGDTVNLNTAAASAPTAPDVVELDPASQLNPKYIFESFVIGASNRFAHAAAFAVAEAPAKAYNPLFIYGESGLGKTHLLHAVGDYAMSLYPKLKTRYVSTEEFTNSFITAIQGGDMKSFQREYREVDLLLIDDIQFLSEKERTQEEFFHTFNALYNAEKQIVMTSDRPPRQIGHLEERLRSRFEWGLMVDVTPPDLETRIAILRKKVEAEQLGVSDDVLEFIASRVQSNIRELEGALIRVTAYASLQRVQADLHLAETVLRDLFPSNQAREVSVTLIMEEVAEYFDLTVDDLTSKSRTRRLSTARQVAMYLTRELTEMSLPKIGQAFGGRDHTTVLHAVNKVKNLMHERRATFDQAQELTNRIKRRSQTA